MYVTQSQKFTLFIVVALLILGTTLAFVSLHFMGTALEVSMNNAIDVQGSIVQERNRELEHTSCQFAELAASNEKLAQSTITENIEELKIFAKNIQKATSSDFVIITDEKGVVLTRSHNDHAGDTISQQITVARALRGEISSTVGKGSFVPLGIRASAPIRFPLSDTIIGTITVGTSFANERYIDHLKELTKLDVSVLQDGKRLMTTLMDNAGRRTIGSSLADPSIQQKVLQDGQELISITVINDIEYGANYWPIRDYQGKILGAWFVGAPIEKLLNLRDSAVRNTFLAGGGTLLVLLALACLVSIRMSRPIRQITAYAKKVAADPHDPVTLDIYSHDDMGMLADSLRSMITSLQENIAHAEVQTKEAQRMRDEANKAMEETRQAHARAESARREGMLSAAARIEEVVVKIHASMEALDMQATSATSSAKNSSTRLSETATAMEEMNSTVLEVARNAGDAAVTSTEARTKAEDGAQIVKLSVDAIQSVHDQSLALQEVMDTLTSQAQSINQIMEVISDIADQTNLLALNAAIEAARAGEAGRGFAVVADEVRKLAEKTMASTADVGHAIHSIQESARQSHEQVEKSVEAIEHATQYAQKSGEALGAIVGLVESAADQVRAIAAASEEQSAASEEINRSISDVNGLSEQVAEAMQSSEQELRRLLEQTSALEALITSMKTEQ